MECITVLKNPERSVTNYPPTFDIVAKPQSTHISGESRFCSHKNQTFIHGAFLALFIVSFVSHLYLHSQLLAKTNEIAILQDKVNDILTAIEIDQINFKTQVHKENGISTGYSPIEENRRVRRDHQCEVPHFFLKGHNEQHQGGRHDYISETGRFFWKIEHVSVNNRTFQIVQNHSAGTNYLDGLRVMRSGTYRVFAQVHVNGRTDRAHDLAVGINLKMIRNHRYGSKTNILTKVFITQENKGRYFPAQPGVPAYPRRYPVDVLKLDGLFYLQREDVIYVSKPEDQENNPHIRYNNREGFAHFGGYMVEPTGPCIS